jgi:eukaryotic-like serine/threonine-protein kinase
MGHVHLARDTRLGRRVAIKFLVADDAATHERMLSEARATASCHHENIVVIHEADVDDGRPYIVFEHLEGTSLRALYAGGRLAPARAVELIAPVVRALVHAHELGVVHRDLKPENVFVTSAGTIKVLDFGLAAPPSAHATNELTGTLPYMAPEQLWGHEIDGRTDQWAVGIMLFEALAGQHPLAPYTARSLMKSAALLDEPMPRLGAVVPDAPRALAELVERCLAKRRNDRFPDALGLLGELEALAPRARGRSLAADECPYPGLTAFQESDGDRFFGRERDVARLVAALRERALVGVVGPSGVGKSSFVRAGLLPALRASGEPWDVHVITPGRRPLASLAALVGADADTLRREPGLVGAHLRARAIERGERGARTLLIVDQLEELYTLVPDRDERCAFTACLRAAADDPAAPVRVLVAMRADLLDRAAEDRELVEELTRGLLLLAPLTGDALRDALVRPLDSRGYAFEDARLADEILAPLAGEPGALPLLQFAATRLWSGRDAQRKLLLRATYEAIGGVSGALARHADEVIATLAPSAQRLARALFQRLVTPDDTRAIVDLDELLALGADPAETRRLVEQLAHARLLVVQTRGDAAGPTVALVHESLIARWPTLRGWLDEAREDVAFVAQLRAATAQWERSGRPDGLLWRGETTRDARRFRARRGGELAPRERAFLEAAFALDTRAARLRRAVVTTMIALLSITVAIGAVALVRIRGAEKNARAEAARAQREAEHAREAERRVSDQLALLRAEQRAKQAAQAEAARGKEDLADANGQLRSALHNAQVESTHAHDEATRANDLAASLQKTNARLERLLAEERARGERLARERSKLATELK